MKSVTNAAGLAKAVLAETLLAAQGPGATSEINVAVIGDFEFTDSKGANAEAALITRMNNVDGIFSMQLGVQINVNRIDTFASANDPFSDETDAGMLLDELTDYRFATPAQNANGLTHLFTGRNLDTTTVGIAYTGALCSRRYGAGLTQGDHSVTLDSLIAAHEIGHNFGAPHDGTSGSACESTPPDFLMAATLNGSDTFSDCSITEMQDDVNRASCITALPSTDVAIVVGSQPGTVLLGDPATFTLEVNSIGTTTATNVVANVTIPPSMTLSSVSATSGSCTNGAGNATCTLGSIAAGSGVTISVTAVPASTGNADFVGSVTATADTNSNNNQVTVRLTVGPAVDLVASAAASAQIALDQSITIEPIVENRASISATDVTVTVTPDTGIRIDSASWPPGNCNIAGNVLTCQASSLSGGSSDALQIDVTGTVAGSRSYTMSVTAAETDRDTSNNNASGQVSVGSGGSGGSGGGANSSGGGSSSLLFLALLMFAHLLLLRAAKRNRRGPTAACVDGPACDKSCRVRRRPSGARCR
jgi:uncharacterized repeat protein (TIGR01451 family)